MIHRMSYIPLQVGLHTDSKVQCAKYGTQNQHKRTTVDRYFYNEINWKDLKRRLSVKDLTAAKCKGQRHRVNCYARINIYVVISV